MTENIKPIRIIYCIQLDIADQIGREQFEKYLKENPIEKQLLYTFETKLKRKYSYIYYYIVSFKGQLRLHKEHYRQ